MRGGPIPDGPARRFLFRCVVFEMESILGVPVDPESLSLVLDAWDGLEVRCRVPSRKGGSDACETLVRLGREDFLPWAARGFRTPGDALEAMLGEWGGIFPLAMPGVSSREEAELYLESLGGGLD